jgi:hypothetical protein
MRGLHGRRRHLAEEGRSEQREMQADGVFSGCSVEKMHVSYPL